jgi:serine protease AprX
MLEANPRLEPSDLREGLAATAVPLEGVDKERQGAGMVRPRRAVEWAIERR